VRRVTHALLPNLKAGSKIVLMMSRMGAIAPEESVKGLLARIDELTLENTGTFWHANGEVLPW
jgi:hypothetical protein